MFLVFLPLNMIIGQSTLILKLTKQLVLQNANLYTELYLKWARDVVAPPKLNYEPHARAYII